MKNFLLIKIIFILLIFPNYTFGKGLPPGTGSNDVPVNLLILLDRSGSMAWGTGGGIKSPTAIAVDSSSNSYVAMSNSIVKVDYDTMAIDTIWSFNPTGNCLIGDIKELRVHGNKLYVVDYNKDRLFRIDLTSTICDWSVSINNPRSMDIKNNILYALGSEMLVYNLSSTTPSKINCAYNSHLKNDGQQSNTSIAIDSSGVNLYVHKSTKLRRFAIGSDKCPSTSRSSEIATPGASRVEGFGFKPGSDTIGYLPVYDDAFYKFTLNASRTTADMDKSNNTSYVGSTPSTVSPNKMYVDYPFGLDIDSTNGRIFLISQGSKSVVHVTDYEMQFIKETVPSSRMKGAKIAIEALVSDSSLTSHVDFGLGVWSSGTSSTIFDGWNDQGTLDPDDDVATPCASSNCLKVRVNRDGATQIIKKLPAVQTGGGTSAESFATLAKEYLLHGSLSPIDTDLDCQYTHVVIIGDGDFNSDDDRDAGIAIIKNLFDSHKIKTHMVAYGGGISTSGLVDFELVALAGGTGKGTTSDGVLVADTPIQLKTQLRARITDIVADNFAFTAPSIPPNKNESSSAVYQSQFKHKSRAQWRGSLIRTTIDANGTLNTTSDWDASKVLPNPDSRKIWSVIPGTDHTLAVNKNNNFIAANSVEITNALKIFNYEVQDYHSETGSPADTRRCFGTAGVADGNADDIKGLINFIRGQDYFDYDADCNLTENRVDSVSGENAYLGDIYHSELLVVGAPNANTSFTNKSQEAYWRSTKNYGAWAKSLQNRKEIIYVGANDGMLHAFNAATGVEEWGFVPPLIAGILPTMVSKALNKSVAGGTDAIYGVDGSPIVHDMYFKSPLGGAKTWHTILMVPYGRGGKGFSILDVTAPDSPLHLFSVYNDSNRKIVSVIDHNGNLSNHTYVGNSYIINELKEAREVSLNYQADPQVGLEQCDDTKNNQCYESKTWTLETNPKIPGLTKADFTVKRNGANYNNFNISYDARGDVKFTFDDSMKFLAYSDANATSDHLVITIDSANPAVGVQSEPGYDYSRLGETWSQPRILRIPNDGTGDINIDNDIYVAVLGGGFGGANPEIGSNLFVINLQQDPADNLFAKIEKQITIKDLDNDIPNSTPALPVVITADEISANYTGGLVYLNDFEGKITKFNLTNMTTDKEGNPIQMYDSTILFNVGATKQNGRYMYHSMDAGTTRGSNVFWMFAGTGDYERLIARNANIDNVLLGIKDKNFPYYKNITDDPLSAEDLSDCSDTTNDKTGDDCPTSAELGWYIKLDNSRKVTAEPTLTRGRVIFPIFEPTLSVNACTTGKAFICNVTARCGTPKNTEIGSADDLECLEVGTGVLSKVVVFGKKLFANIAGEAGAGARQGEKKDLVSINAPKFEIESFRNSWRENY